MKFQLVGHVENRMSLLEKTFINNEIKLNNTDQYNRRNNTEIQGIPQSVKSKDLDEKSSACS